MRRNGPETPTSLPSRSSSPAGRGAPSAVSAVSARVPLGLEPSPQRRDALLRDRDELPRRRRQVRVAARDEGEGLVQRRVERDALQPPAVPARGDDRPVGDRVAEARAGPGRARRSCTRPRCRARSSRRRAGRARGAGGASGRRRPSGRRRGSAGRRRASGSSSARARGAARPTGTAAPPASRAARRGRGRRRGARPGRPRAGRRARRPRPRPSSGRPRAACTDGRLRRNSSISPPSR